MGENANAIAAVRFNSCVFNGRKRQRFRRSAFQLLRFPWAKTPPLSPCVCFHPSVFHGRKRQHFRRGAAFAAVRSQSSVFHWRKRQRFEASSRYAFAQIALACKVRFLQTVETLGD
jgi:hypothetical protein